MNQKERMLAGLPYKAWMDRSGGGAGRLPGKLYRFNLLPPGGAGAGARPAERDFR